MRSIRSARVALLTAGFASMMLRSPAVFARDGAAQAVALHARLSTGMPHRVVVRVPYAFVALDTGVEVFDVSSPTSPVAVGHLYLSSPAYDLQLVGSRLFVANGESGMQVVSVANVASPVVEGRLSLPLGSGAEVRSISVVGGLACLAESGSGGSSDHGLRVVDVSSPATPFELGRLPLDNGALSVAIAGTTAFVGLGSTLNGRLGVIAVDVADPLNPLELPTGFVRLGLPVNQLALDGAVAFVAVGDKSAGALATIQMSDPSTPVLLDYEALRTGAMGLALGAGVVYAAVRESGVVAYDRASPAAMVRVGSLAFDSLAVAVAASGTQVFAGMRSSNGGGGLFAIDVSNPSAMGRLGGFSHAEATAAAADRSLAFLLRRDGLTVFDATTPTAPFAIGGWTAPGADLTGIAIDGGVAAITEGRVVHLLDVTNPAAPSEIASVTVSEGVAMRPVLNGGTLYVVTGSGLEVFGLGAQAAPSTGGVLATAGTSSGFAVDGTLGYLVAGEQVITLDLTTPTAPGVVQTLTIPGEDLLGVAAQGALAVVTGSRNRLYALDVANPASPSVAGMVAGGQGVDVRLIGDRAVVAGGRDGVRVIDVSNVTAPVEEAFLDTSGEVNWLANEGSTLYLAAVAAQHWVVQCTTCNAACADAYPTMLANSLRMVKMPTLDAVSWQLASGSGSTNLHRTASKSTLPNLHADMGTLVGTSAGTTFTDAFSPPPSVVAHYRVYGAGDCTGLSYP